MGIIKEDLKKILDLKYQEYNNLNFIEKDPIQIPHLFEKKEDIEISAFLISVISWGNRKSIINSGKKMMNILDYSPYDFIINCSEKDIKNINFTHRTFNSIDLQFFIRSLKNIYKNHNSLENIFIAKNKTEFMFDGISNFREIFFSIDHEKRSEKHISNPKKGSCCKRINMFFKMGCKR